MPTRSKADPAWGASSRTTSTSRFECRSKKHHGSRRRGIPVRVATRLRAPSARFAAAPPGPGHLRRQVPPRWPASAMTAQAPGMPIFPVPAAGYLHVLPDAVAEQPVQPFADQRARPVELVSPLLAGRGHRQAALRIERDGRDPGDSAADGRAPGERHVVGRERPIVQQRGERDRGAPATPGFTPLPLDRRR